MAKCRRTRIVPGEKDWEGLERIKFDPQSNLKHVPTASIILCLGDGPALSQTMRANDMSKPMVRRRRDHFLVESVGDLHCDVPGRTGRKPVSQEKAGEAVELAMPPAEHCSQRTLRVLAKMQGVSVSKVSGFLKRIGLKPHRAETFKVSRDPRFEMKVRGVVGLHADPPDSTVAIPVNGNTQMQALGRTHAPLPMKPGHPQTRTHDCKRRATACLVPALDAAADKVAGRMVERRRSEQFFAFLGQVCEGIELETPVHFILDNVSSRKSTEAGEWLKDNPDWTFHFPPTSASWMNAVEGFFSKLSKQTLKHATRSSTWLTSALQRSRAALSNATPRTPAHSAGASSTKISRRHGGRAATRSGRNWHRENQTTRKARCGTERRKKNNDDNLSAR